MSILKSLGLDPSLLDENDISVLNSVATELKITEHSRNIDPNKILSSLRKKGFKIDNLIKKMRGSVQPKVSNRIGRNEKCPCNSGKKFKKCCYEKNT